MNSLSRNPGSAPAFHLGFHCLYPFKSFSYTKGKRLIKQTGEAEDGPWGPWSEGKIHYMFYLTCAKAHWWANFVWFFTSLSPIFQLCQDGSSWVKPVLSKDECVLPTDTTQWLPWGSNPQPLDLQSSWWANTSCDMWFSTMWCFDKCRLRRAFAASF